MPPTLVLDLDGTLVDSVPDLAAALNRLMVSRNLAPFERPEVTAMVGDGARILLTRAFAARDEAFDEPAFDAFMADYTQNVAVESRPYPGAVETLAWFADEGWRLAVCTNKPEKPTRALLQALSLAPFFSAVGAGDSFLTRKPDPRHLLSTLDAAGGDVATAIMVGDHSNDVRAANDAGIACIFAGWGYGPVAMAEGAVMIAERFSDLPDMAENLLRED